MVIKLIEKDCFMASIDLKDAYYCVPIAWEDKKVPWFIWQGSLFQFLRLPNGLSCAPRKFRKLLKPVLSDLHLRGHISSTYIGDMYLQGRSYHDCLNNVIDSVKQFDFLVLIAHPHKLIFNPSQQLASTCLLHLCPQSGSWWGECTIVSCVPGVCFGPLYYQIKNISGNIREVFFKLDTRMFITKDKIITILLLVWKLSWLHSLFVKNQIPSFLTF